MDRGASDQEIMWGATKEKSVIASAITLFSLLIKGRVKGVEVFAVEIILCNAKRIAEALVVHQLALTQILDRLAHVGIVHHAQDIIIGHACLLLC